MVALSDRGSAAVRSALLSTLETTQAGRPRAFERLGGRSLIAWQVDLARDLGCQRIICLAERVTEALGDLRHQVEAEGLDFHLVRGPLPLVSLLSADQELAVFADGLVADRERLASAFNDNRGVLALPVEEGLAAGFERIDADYAWGGVLVARARIVEQLAEMPPDSDTISLLLRLALQAGTPLIPLQAEVVQNGEWLLVTERAALVQREEALLDRSIESELSLAPGIAASSRVARRLAPDGLERGPAFAMATGYLGLIGALTLAQFSMPVAGLAVFALAAFALGIGAALDRLKARLRGIGKSAGRADWRRLAVDGVLGTLLAMPLEQGNLPERFFLPVMLLALLRLAETLVPERWRASWQDRILLAAVLLPAAWFGVLDQALAVFCLLTVSSCLFFRGKIEITRA